MIVTHVDYKAAIDLINELLKCDCLSEQQRQDLIYRSAGITAEKEIAYSLTAYFGTSKDIYVFNNLKIEHAEVRAQVDHLIVTKKAMYYVESKSISDGIEVNEYDEWFRIYNKVGTPINSPVEQVKQQAVIIRNFLKDHLCELTIKLLGLQYQIGYYPEHCFVAISQKGRISGSGREKYKDTVMKYDNIPTKIEKNENLMIHQAITLETPFLSSSEASKLADVLLKYNVSRELVEEIRQWAYEYIAPQYIQAIFEKDGYTPSATDEPQSICHQKKCPACTEGIVAIKYGKYGYYFSCDTCNHSSSIKETCPSYGKPAKIRKDKQSYYLVCRVCDISDLYYVNPAVYSKLS